MHDSVHGGANLSIEAIKNYKKHVHLGAFSYGYKFLPDDAHSAVFAFIVYDAAAFLVLVSPKATARIPMPSPPAIVLQSA